MQRVKPSDAKLKEAIARKGEVSKPTTSQAVRVTPQPAAEQPLCCCCFNVQNVNRKSRKKCLIVFLYFLGYVLFLGTFFIIILYSSLIVIAKNQNILQINKTELRSFALNGIGLTVIPESNDVPVIYYDMNNETQYDLYVQKIEKLLNVNGSTNGNEDILGPCGKKPYGYGADPCVYIKINKQKGWFAEPLENNDTEAVPAPIKSLVKLQSMKLLLHCEGSEPWLTEHLGKIKYYPDPPGYDPKRFPIKMDNPTPLVAMQLSGFTTGLSITVACSLWYKGGTSKVEFVIYILKT